MSVSQFNGLLCDTKSTISKNLENEQKKNLKAVRLQVTISSESIKLFRVP